MYEQDRDQSPGLRAFHMVAPWVALLAIVWAIAVAYGSFRSAQISAQQGTSGTAGSGSAAATSSANATGSAAGTSTITGIEAIAVVNLKLRATPSQTSEVVATAKKGAVLDVQSKSGGYFRVKDSAGHVGWVPNDTKYIILRSK